METFMQYVEFLQKKYNEQVNESVGEINEFESQGSLARCSKEKLPAVRFWLHRKLSWNLHKAHSLDSMCVTKYSRGRHIERKPSRWKQWIVLTMHHFWSITCSMFLTLDNYRFLQCFLIHSSMNINNAWWVYLSKLYLENWNPVRIMYTSAYKRQGHGR